MTSRIRVATIILFSVVVVVVDDDDDCRASSPVENYPT